MKKINMGVIGLGRIGKIHAAHIRRFIPQANLMAVADPLLDQEWLQQYPIEVSSDNPQAIIENEAIDAIVICTPSDTHAELIKQAASRGKHIFCEKPIALDPEVIRDVIQTVERAQVKLQVGFNRRFDPDFSAVKQQLQTDQLGNIHMIRITARDPQPPSLDYVKQSGGLFLDMSIHDFDMARFLADSEVVEVFAMGDALINPKLRAIDDIDTAITTLKFQNGAYAIIDNSRQAVYGYDQRIEVFGQKGCVSVDNIKQNHTIISTADNISSAKPLYFLERYTQSFILEMQSFVHSVSDDKPVAVSGFDGLMPVLIGLAAKQSLKEKKSITVATE